MPTYSREYAAFRKTCIFCRIADGREPTKIYYQDDEVVVFEDITPAAEFHLLAIPVEHIEHIGRLKPNQIYLLDRLKRAGDIVLERVTLGKTKWIQSRIPMAILNECKIGRIRKPRVRASGFHKQDFISVPHLHMHIVAPVDTMNANQLERVFGRDCFRFKSYKTVRQHLVDRLLPSTTRTRR